MSDDIAAEVMMKMMHARQPMMDLQRAESSGSLADEIASTLAAEICGSRFHPGERILHQELTARFNVSFGTIREALLKLERERLIEILPRRGARVVRLTIEEVENLLAVRCATYPVLARAAVARGTDEELSLFKREVDALATAMRSDVSVEDVIIQAYNAGARLAQASRNDWAASIVHSTARQPNWAYAHRGLETRKERFEAAQRWSELGKRVLDRDGESAAAAAEAMVLRSIHAVLPKLYAEMEPGGPPAPERLKIFPALTATDEGKPRRGRNSS